MKSRIILFLSIIAGAALTSCSTAYKSGQTPDDVYYSPAHETDSYVEVNNDDNRTYRGQDNTAYNDYNYDDLYLRMRVTNRYRWSAFDDYNDWNYYGYNGYGNVGHYGINYGYNPYSFNSYWNSYYLWNSYYNPYCYNIIAINPKASPAVYTKVRNFSLAGYTGGYNNSNGTNSIRPTRSTFNNSFNNYNNTNSTNSSGSSLGSSLRKVFSGSGNSNSSRGSYYTPSSSGDRPTRSYTPTTTNSSSSSPARSYTPSSSSGSSSGGSSGGGGTTRPGRG